VHENSAMGHPYVAGLETVPPEGNHKEGGGRKKGEQLEKKMPVKHKAGLQAVMEGDSGNKSEEASTERAD